MPELPDITVYIEALERRILHQPMARVQINSPFLLRTARPPLESILGRNVIALRRIGKRIAIGFEDDYWLVLHLMIAGRLHWQPPEGKPDSKAALAVLEFPSGILSLTEAGTRKRASLHLVEGKDGLEALNPGGLEIIGCSRQEFDRQLRHENHTLKRALTDPQLFSGIGNAYSDEILHRARLSPIALTQKLSPEAMDRLWSITQETLLHWVETLRRATGSAFPEKVTAFRPEMAVHGKFGQPCPVCGSKVQRIRYATNETNYCPTCQTDGKLLADRSLSLLLKRDWPRTPEELEELRRR